MRKYMMAEVEKHQTIFSQLGAQVHVMNSLLCYITFDIDGTEVSYVYNVNKKDKYFLQRIEPYPEPAGTFNNEDELIDIIKIDIEQFKNAKNSHVFSDFVEINKSLSQTVRNFEDLYLYYNVPHDTMDNIKEKLDDIRTMIKEAKDSSERVYNKKDPDTI
ncbi:hypothetical protein GOQ27_10370 [Clostridium sp. D2Q-11]|uniref:Uncharacterized protein n=1 Tax=Anaeromonas frigoriresistens TaxID=2683708 RepID=A0A942UXP6_9FIRM|nr:hypothetical protein [Anaeromonas frigoriresistens]MBS4538871.1 hypothetical protein [Anaeromonas frigoriresistens]